MNWINTTVGEYCPFTYGKSLPKTKRCAGKFPVYGSNGCVGHHAKPLINSPGVIIGRKGSCGAVHLSETPFWPIDTSFYLVNESFNELRFIYYLLKSLGLEEMNSDSAVPGLNRENAHRTPIKIPEKREDREKLGFMMASFDEKIASNNSMNRTLESIAQRIFKSWFVDFDPIKANIDNIRFSNLPPDIQSLFPNELTESPIGPIPKGWHVSEIGSEVQCVGGSTPTTSKPEYWENGDVLWTTPKDLSSQESKVMIDTSRRITDDGLKKISSGLLPKDTVLMSSRAPVGYLAIAKEPLAINQGYIGMKCNKTLGPMYILNWLEQKMEDIKQHAGGTTFAEISKKSFRPLPVLVPDEVVVKKYEEIASEMYSRIELNARQNQFLRRLRDRILPKLLNGSLMLQSEEEAA